MALIYCPECNKQISDKAFSCPNCGYPMRSNTQRPSANELYCVIINGFSISKMELIKSVRDILDCGLKEAKDKTNNLPFFLAKGISLQESENLKKQAEARGLHVVIESYEKGDDCNIMLKKNKKGDVFCPRCGSTAITTGQRGYSLFTGFLGSSKTVNRCGKCGYSWEP